MSGVEQIVQTILSIAQNEAEGIRRDADDRIERLREQANQEVESRTAVVRSQAAARHEEIIRRTDTMVSLSRRRAKLACKRQLIDEIFDGVLERLCSMDREQYLSFIEKLLSRSASGGEELIVGMAENRIDTDAMTKLNAGLERAGIAPVVLSSQRENIAGGFILKKNGIITNCSFEMLVRQARGQWEPEVAAQLFPGEEQS